MFRIRNSADSQSVDVDSVEQIGPTVQSGRPGRYVVDEIRDNDDSLRARRITTAWGTAIHHPDGRVALRPFF
jgi:hypothetical protein